VLNNEVSLLLTAGSVDAQRPFEMSATARPETPAGSVEEVDPWC
jgi:hypothetical protein